jgi:hypothetical protein
MTHYVLRDDLSYCRVGERLVFLDIDSDKYFHLPFAMEQTFLAYASGDECADAGISTLVERSLLVEKTNTTIESRPDVEPAVRSAVEAPQSSRHLRASELAEVFWTVLHTRTAMKRSTLKRILDRIAVARRLQATPNETSAEISELRLADAAAVFRRARLYVPIEMRCLLDAIAMTRFLLRRRIHAHIVFGIALDPFSAHCWVQVGDLVLNDTVGNVASHTPIRVV